MVRPLHGNALSIAASSVIDRVALSLNDQARTQSSEVHVPDCRVTGGSVPELNISIDAMYIIALAFACAGLVKGVIGGGLPAVAVPIMAGALEPALGAALTLVPVIATNIWLLLQGGLFTQVMRRYWPFLVTLGVGSALGSQILATTSPDTMRLAIGSLVIILSPLPFMPRGWAISPATQRWLNPLAGFAMGLVGGATVMLAPAIVYFVALRIEKNQFVASMGAIALFSMLPLFAGLAVSRVLGASELLLSASALIPAAAGMAAGVWLRGRISQRGFQVLLSIALLAIGLNLIRLHAFG
ncbi:MAG: sulfite exporter TauE/SafE family protein [Hyphomicrobiaceae bacterium]